MSAFESLPKRIVGVETEFGCFVEEETVGSPEAAVETLKDYLFYELKLGALDRRARDDVFEPAESGGFLMNGARLYVDAVGSHLEYATAECLTLPDLVANDRAGHRQIVRAIRDLDLADVVSIYNNSVDHFGGHTFGCHENYMIRADESLFERGMLYLYPFLVTRQIYAGVGRVGGHLLTAAAGIPTQQQMMDNVVDYIWVSNIYGVVPDDSVEFQLSQRADHILKTMASRVRFNRALLNPKWETMYSHGGYTRLHMLFGESNQNEYAYALKVGATKLALRLIEDEAVADEVLIAQPLMALRVISRDPTFEWQILRIDGTPISAIDVQRMYLERAERYRDTDAETNWVLDEWARTLDDLERDPMAVGDRIDWVAKRKILETYMQENGSDWSDPALHSVDLEYHNIDPSLSLFHALQESGETKRVCQDVDIVMAMTDPPQNTRAKARARLVEQILAKKKRHYAIDWNEVTVAPKQYFDLSDPFDPYDTIQLEA
jgi:proteasome accessory factor A